jgi:uncharacterized protein
VPKYVVILKDKIPSALTKEIYYSHVDHLRRSAKEGKLLLAGPLKGQDKVLQIVEAASLAEAEQIVKADPYINKKHYGSYEIIEFLEANDANNWLMDTPRIQEMLRKLP